ncbi:hypothetical protein JIG36_33975 [Actinoplanes sp. LDG1-06]|uniref:Galactose oxidase n=1 Tax=Paractinoplanes ovalisporus TaxID=2810368 RepID=A0ABS2AL47_9ACTN|nr:kelch repeat-containing protein [Actinoplanes ovalisporus]MBM2620521.1 hypothetical protein [Actinoplanes ovalisporus]
MSADWLLSADTLPVGKDGACGVKLNDRQVLWAGGTPDDPADSNRVIVYDVVTRRFREVAPVPPAKRMDRNVAVGVLSNGHVIVTGGSLSQPGGANRLSYRYDPGRDKWSRTGDLPERQEWLFTPVTRLRDGRLLAVGGRGDDGATTGAGSVQAFVYDAEHTSTVEAVDPRTAVPTGDTVVVQGRWDYTRRVSDHHRTTLGRGHLFGNAVRLRDGRVFVVGGHVFWRTTTDGVSVQAVDTDYFEPETGEWRTGAPLPVVAGEDNTTPNSHGGRTNGVGVAVMDDGKVVIAGGATHTDGADYFKTILCRRSILVMTARPRPAESTYVIAPDRIPSGNGSGGVTGDGGRNQLPCYAVPGNRAVLAGGQDSNGDDLYDTYVFRSHDGTLHRGPDRSHKTPGWLPQHPEYPAGYQTAFISTRAVSMANSKLVFPGGVLVHGGAYDAVSDSFENPPGTRYADQLGHHTPG